jgi:hypothetical protein
VIVIVTLIIEEIDHYPCHHHPLFILQTIDHNINKNQGVDLIVLFQVQIINLIHSPQNDDMDRVHHYHHQ